MQSVSINSLYYRKKKEHETYCNYQLKKERKEKYAKLHD